MLEERVKVDNLQRLSWAEESLVKQKAKVHWLGKEIRILSTFSSASRVDKTLTPFKVLCLRMVTIPMRWIRSRKVSSASRVAKTF